VATLLFGQAQGLAPTTNQHYSGKQPYKKISKTKKQVNSITKEIIQKKLLFIFIG